MFKSSGEICPVRLGLGIGCHGIVERDEETKLVVFLLTLDLRRVLYGWFVEWVFCGCLAVGRSGEEVEVAAGKQAMFDSRCDGIGRVLRSQMSEIEVLLKSTWTLCHLLTHLLGHSPYPISPPIISPSACHNIT